LPLRHAGEQAAAGAVALHLELAWLQRRVTDDVDVAGGERRHQPLERRLHPLAVLLGRRRRAAAAGLRRGGIDERERLWVLGAGHRAALFAVVHAAIVLDRADRRNRGAAAMPPRRRTLVRRGVERRAESGA